MFQEVIRNFQRKLVNLSGSNRSLLLLKLSKESDLDLSEIDYLLNKPSYNIIENLLSGKSTIALCNFMDSRNEKGNIVGRLIQKIDRKDKFMFEETGSQELYIVWPFVKGKLIDYS